MKQALIIRKDLELDKGKIAAQLAHAAILASDKSKYKKEWQERGAKKITLKAENLQELKEIYEEAKQNDLPVSLIKDAGLTQIPKGTITSIGIGPAPEKEIDPIIENLKLL